MLIGQFFAQARMICKQYRREIILIDLSELLLRLTIIILIVSVYCPNGVIESTTNNEWFHSDQTETAFSNAPKIKQINNNCCCVCCAVW